MAILQWIKPTPTQLIEADDLAKSVGRELYWDGDTLYLDATEEELPSEPDQ